MTVDDHGDYHCYLTYKELEFIGFQDCFGGVGPMADLQEYFGMADHYIVDAAEKVMQRK